MRSFFIRALFCTNKFAIDFHSINVTPAVLRRLRTFWYAKCEKQCQSNSMYQFRFHRWKFAHIRENFCFENRYVARSTEMGIGIRFLLRQRYAILKPDFTTSNINYAHRYISKRRRAHTRNNRYIFIFWHFFIGNWNRIKIMARTRHW